MEYDPIEGLTISMRRIEDKLDKHDDKFELIAQTLQKLVAVDIELKTTKDSLSAVWVEVMELKEHQTTDGCPAHKNFIAVRNEQLKGYDALTKECKANYVDVNTRLKTIEELPKKRLEVAIVEVIKWATIIILGIVGVKIGLTK